MLQRYPKRVFRLRTKDAWERRSLHMVLIGCDFHPSWQQVSWLDMETGETGEQKLVHAGGEAKQFYEQLAAPVLIGMETTGNSQWFIELVEDLGHEIWIGDAAQIRSRRRPESGYSFRKSPIPLRTVQTPVETEATAPHVCVSGETGNLSAPTASATL